MSEKIVFFDGVCNLCNSAVDFIVRNDKNHILKIASLQGETAKKYLSQEQITNLDSLVYFSDGEVYERSTGALKISGFLGFPWSLFKVFLILPSFLRDPVYNFIAKHRYKMFGKKESCRLPGPSEKEVFLP